MEWTPYTGPVVGPGETALSHLDTWEHTFPYYDGQPMTAQFYSPILRPFHNPMTARNHGRFAAKPGLRQGWPHGVEVRRQPESVPYLDEP